MSFLIKEVDYKILYKNVKNINLRVNSDCEIVVSAPFKTSEKFIHEFVNKHADKMLKAQEKIRQRNDKLNESVDDKSLIILLGKKRDLQVIKDTKFSYSITADKVVLYYRNLENDYDKMIREIATKVIEELNSQVVDELNILKVPVSIRKYKNCYGKNIDKKKIVLNYKLVHMDIQYIKHVLYHEYAHMEEFNHSRKFYDILSRYDKNYKIHKRYLDENFHKYL